MASDLNINILYLLHKKKVLNPTSKFIFSKVFNEQFNLSFHAPVTDSCRRCDSLAIKLRACDNPVDKLSLENEKKLHLLTVNAAREGIEKNVDMYRHDDCHHAYTYPLF